MLLLSMIIILVFVTVGVIKSNRPELRRQYDFLSDKGFMVERSSGIHAYSAASEIFKKYKISFDDIGEDINKVKMIVPEKQPIDLSKADSKTREVHRQLKKVLDSYPKWQDFKD